MGHRDWISLSRDGWRPPPSRDGTLSRRGIPARAVYGQFALLKGDVRAPRGSHVGIPSELLQSDAAVRETRT